MKICKKCKREYPMQEYQTAAGKNRYSKCGGCRRAEDKKRKSDGQVWDSATLRTHLIEAMGGECVQCGFDKSFDILEIDVPGRGAAPALSRAISNFSYGPTQEKWDAIMVSLRRGIVLCPNCRKGYRCGVFRHLDKLRESKAKAIRLPMPVQ